MDRADIVHENFLRRIAAHDFPVGAPPSGPLSAVDAVRVFRSACLSRALDRTSRAMQRAGQGYYTIGSSGHEGLAALALALRPTDLAFLHYRDAAFQIARATQVPGQSIAWDMLLSFATSSDDPISGGRHKVLGSKALASRRRPRPSPRTFLSLSEPPIRSAPLGGAGLSIASSTITQSSCAPSATHPPITRRRRVRSTPHVGPRFSCRRCRCSSSARTTASASRPRRRAAGFGIVQESARAGLLRSRRLDVDETFATASKAVEFGRWRNRPAFLRLRTVRLYGHAGADVQTVYMSKADVEAEEANDPLLHMARQLSHAGVLAPEETLAIYRETDERVTRIAERVVERPRLRTAADVMASSFRHAGRVARSTAHRPRSARRRSEPTCANLTLPSR